MRPSMPGYISVTPLFLDLTHQGMRETLAQGAGVGLRVLAAAAARGWPRARKSALRHPSELNAHTVNGALTVQG